MDFLSQTRRKALYGVVSAVATIVVILGWAPQVAVDNWVEVIFQLVGLLALVLASIKSKRADYTGIYGGAALLVGALTAAGVWNDGQASQIYDVMAQVAVLLPMLVAFVRTDTSTPTGQPAAEVAATRAARFRPGGIVGRDPRDGDLRDERGAIDGGVIWVIVGVLLIVALLMYIL